MNKILNRLIYLNLIIGFFYHPSISFKGSLSEMPIDKILITLWVFVSIVLMWYLWGCMFYHWKNAKFKNPVVKKLWLLILIIGGILKFYGPMIYYPIVMELKKTIEREEIR